MIEYQFGNRPRGLTEVPKDLPACALHVKIYHEIFSDYFILTLDNGHTEEKEPEEARQWFKERGANMDAVEAALDQAWNLKHADFYISSPREPLLNRPSYAPKV